MQTDNPGIRSLVEEIAALSASTFPGRFAAVYVMGSLARGGFSKVASDIDLGVILEGPLMPQDEDAIDQVLSSALKRNAAVTNKVSIFWGSIESINGIVDAGRYPPFDRLDLIDHAVLLSGRDIKRLLTRPSKKELETSSAEFALKYLGSDQVVKEFRNCKLLASKGTVSVTKAVLFPARFIYLEKTGKIAGNESSFQYYVDRFSGRDTELVRHAYHWRMHALPDALDEVVEQLEKGLVPLYCRFIDIYMERLKDYGEVELSHQLRLWRDKLEAL